MYLQGPAGKLALSIATSQRGCDRKKGTRVPSSPTERWEGLENRKLKEGGATDALESADLGLGLEKNGAGEGDRTLDLKLGKLAL